ncbi:S41 family peptidase [Xanthocytophaga flava]|uniref:S41 family peptidase n=1 Tax=Xanthocytophaga flava TaxID=3048013 RepID=UPI0028D19548|nr:S41 family peptidase [Xanthocytophaga flavus]MDJ1472461.1 S41 family peptidase [Xanthocytophaga flavus]
MQKKILCFWIGLIICLSSFAQTVKLTPTQMQEDFDVFQRALKEAHPGLYRYTDTTTFTKIFDSLSHSFKREMTDQEFYQTLTPAIAQIKCGHTKFHPDGKWTTRYFYATDQLFPWQLYFTQQKVYVLESYAGNLPVAKGTEIIAINGKPVSEVVSSLLTKIFVDGNNRSTRYLELNQGFSAYYANLIGSSPSFQITCRKTDSTTSSLEVPAVTVSQIEAFEKQHPKPEEPTFQLKFLDNQTALIRIKVFYPAQKGDDYEQFLKESFAQLKTRNIQHLILDLRDNEGGLDRWGAQLYSYLTDEKFPYYDRLEMTPTHSYSFAQYADMPKFYGILKMLIKKPKNGPHLWTHHKNLKVQKPQQNAYLGKLYILTNGWSFSVTSEFAAIAHSHQRATFIGQEVGGGYYGNNSGTFIIVKLPHSKFIVGIPMLAYYMAVSGYPYPDHGVIPDHTIEPSIQDILNHTDRELQFTLDLIKQSSLSSNGN